MTRKLHLKKKTAGAKLREVVQLPTEDYAALCNQSKLLLRNLMQTNQMLLQHFKTDHSILF